jgi:transposase
MSSVTVLSGPERRRRWSATEKARIVEESLQPGAVVAAVAHRHDLHPNLLHYWRRQARQAAGRRVTFLPVSVSTEKRSSGRGEGAIEIELGNDVRVRVDATVDEAALGRVLRALGR